MYIKKILLAVVLLGLVAMGGFSWYVYSTVFSPNTAFNNEQAHIYIPTDATYQDVVLELEPLLNDMDDFTAVAQKKGYASNIKAGHY